MTTRSSHQFRLIQATREGEQRARLLETYGDAVVTRMLPALKLAGAEVASYIQGDIEHAAQYGEGAGLYPEETISCERVSYSSISSSLSYAQMELGHLRHHLFGFAFAGLLHLFERQLAQIVDIFRHRYGSVDWGQKERPCLVEVKDLIAVLYRGGVVTLPHVRRDLNRLRLIANAVKHPGSALVEISQRHPDLLWGWYPPMQLSTDFLNLTPELLTRFVHSLAGFWRNFPHE